MRVNIQQRTDEWHQFRKNKIGSSDASTIMGSNPFETAVELWERMKGIRQQKEITAAMQRGIILEDDVRHWAEKQLGMSFQPSMHQNDKIPELIASLDGENIEDRIILEIKISAKAKEKAKNLEYFSSHYTQIQHQFMVTGYEKAYLCCYDEFDGNIIPILRDETYIDELIEKEMIFLECLKNNIPPPLQEKEYRQVEIDEHQAVLVKEWLHVSGIIKKYEDVEKNIRTKILFLADEENIILRYINNPLIRLTKINREGSVDWKELCKAKGISNKDIEEYRKKSNSFYQIREM